MGKKMGTIRDQLKNLKKDQLLIVLLCGVLLVVILLPTESKKNEQEQDQKNTVIVEEQTTDAKEKKLQEILSKVEGVGDAEVMITYYASAEKIVEKDIPVTDRSVSDTDGQGGNSSTVEREENEETIYEKGSDGSQTPYVVQVKEPQIAGVLVVAEGGGNAEVAKNITEAVEALFGVEAHKIKVMKMN